ncbi:adenine-specific DNA-methyltransferase [Zunongwangia mangrovi]|uniref:site-specific DNA-methyltransferase (adenine-specific) n=1 Tax=Zunongwangia mangrovi TaxID=1334022 RepID=A0A1I1HR71_9FLAO|nr:site-specific DNA-methyltransferase [Zunongwangia mangrovi]SFC26587.1 adenine-specific DNA-methyltransferase [Zunongwangia mangrovi]
MDGTSLTPQEIKLQELKKIFPEVFAEGKVDWEKLKATLGEDINFSNERYVLNWAGKSDAFKVLQAPTTKTLIPAKEESVNFEETENIFIEGENLEVLKVLQKSYFGKVKMIYIDPPYNTGNDHFIYPDKFSESKADYERRVGDKDEEGYMTKEGMYRKNSKENGQYHSNWMNMMYPRLFLAKNLLKDDGVIFVSIDDNEIHNLKMMMNEVFGEENFVEQLVWKRRATPPNDRIIGKNHEYILIYAKRIESLKLYLQPRSARLNSRYSNPDNDPNGAWVASDLSANGKGGRLTQSCIFDIVDPKTGKKYSPPKNKCWLYNQEKVERLLKDNKIGFRETTGTPFLKRYLSEVRQGVTLATILDDHGFSQDSAKETKELFDADVFDFPKPIKTLITLIIAATKDNDLILDFFSGSASLAQAVYAQNHKDFSKRKFICVQIAELTGEKSEAKKLGFKTISDISKERIRRAGKKIEEEILEKKKIQKSEIPFNEKETFNPDLGFKVLKLSDSNFKQWQQIQNKDAKALEEQIKLFVDPVSETATIENMVYELLLKSGKDLNSKILNQEDYYSINDNELVLLLEKANQDIIDKIIATKPQKVIALDKLFKDNDQLKTNTVLQMKDAGIEFKTI